MYSWCSHSNMVISIVISRWPEGQHGPMAFPWRIDLPPSPQRHPRPGAQTNKRSSDWGSMIQRVSEVWRVRWGKSIGKSIGTPWKTIGIPRGKWEKKHGKTMNNYYFGDFNKILSRKIWEYEWIYLINDGWLMINDWQFFMFLPQKHPLSWNVPWPL